MHSCTRPPARRVACVPACLPAGGLRSTTKTCARCASTSLRATSRSPRRARPPRRRVTSSEACSCARPVTGASTTTSVVGGGWPPAQRACTTAVVAACARRDACLLLPLPSLPCHARAPASSAGDGDGAAAPAACCRLGARAAGIAELKAHPFFRGIDWEKLERKEIEPPFKPVVASETDIGNFDTTFTSEPAALTPPAPSDLVSSGMRRGSVAGASDCCRGWRLGVATTEHPVPVARACSPRPPRPQTTSRTSASSTSRS